MKVINVNGKDYALKLTIGSIKNLEKRLGENPLNYFSEFGGEKLPELTPLSVMFHACITNMNHGITEEESDNILTDWIAEYAKAHEGEKNASSIAGLATLIVEVFQDAGFISKQKEGKDSKNK